MKNLLISFAIFSVLLLIGCQENSITDPIQDMGQQDLQKNDDPSVHQGTITLTGMLTDPYPVINSYYVINGEVEYQHTLQVLNPVESNPQYLVSLSLSVNAEFTYLCTVCDPENNDISVGTISVETNDIVSVSKGDIYVLEKSFPIQGREDGMVLMCRFLVTTDGIELNSKWLELPGGNTNQTDPGSRNNLSGNYEIYPPVTIETDQQDQ